MGSFKIKNPFILNNKWRTRLQKKKKRFNFSSVQNIDS